MEQAYSVYGLPVADTSIPGLLPSHINPSCLPRRCEAILEDHASLLGVSHA